MPPVTSTRVAALILSEGRFAAVRRETPHSIYHLFPGGKVEAGETHLQALHREIAEELGITVTVGPLVAEVQFGSRRQLYFRAEWVSGCSGTGTGEEYGGDLPTSEGTYTPVWL